MKTSGLDFISAVKAVKDGLCEKAYSESANRYIYKDDENEIEQAVCRFSTILATDYELINPRVPMEEVVETVWMIRYDDGLIDFKTIEPINVTRKDCTIIKLTGTYQRPVKETVKQKVYADRIKIDDGLWGQLTNDFPETLIGKRGTLTFEWEEEA